VGGGVAARGRNAGEFGGGVGAAEGDDGGDGAGVDGEHLGEGVGFLVGVVLDDAYQTPVSAQLTYSTQNQPPPSTVQTTYNRIDPDIPFSHTP
jgi:hypothetical protein